MEYILTYIRQGLPCLFHEITGLYCPGCGGTRAAKALLRADVIASFRYHPVVIYMAVCVLLSLGSWVLAKKLRKPRLQIIRYEIMTYIGVGIVLVNWAVKNYYLVAKGIDLLNF